MAGRLRIGVIGANPTQSWAKRGHLPAILAMPEELELVAVCTTREETARESARIYGARHHFADYRELIACEEVEVVVVSVRAPRHYGPTMAALAAGKHVYTEWPLGANLAEAQEMAAAARTAPGTSIIGLQGRHTPIYRRLKELADEGFFGEVLAIQIGSCGGGLLDKESPASWRADARNGAHNGTIGFGHLIEPVYHCFGPIREVSGVWRTQAPRWLEQDTGRTIDATAPDTVFMQGSTDAGTAVLAYEHSVPWHPSGYRFEIYGREKTALIHADERFADLKLMVGGRGDERLTEMPVPDRLTRVLHSRERDRPFGVAQIWSHYAEAIRSGHPRGARLRLRARPAPPDRRAGARLRHRHPAGRGAVTADEALLPSAHPVRPGAAGRGAPGDRLLGRGRRRRGRRDHHTPQPGGLRRDRHPPPPADRRQQPRPVHRCARPPHLLPRDGAAGRHAGVGASRRRRGHRARLQRSPDGDDPARRRRQDGRRGAQGDHRPALVRRQALPGRGHRVPDRPRRGGRRGRDLHHHRRTRHGRPGAGRARLLPVPRRAHPELRGQVGGPGRPARPGRHDGEPGRRLLPAAGRQAAGVAEGAHRAAADRQGGDDRRGRAARRPSRRRRRGRLQPRRAHLRRHAGVDRGAAGDRRRGRRPRRGLPGLRRAPRHRRAQGAGARRPRGDGRPAGLLGAGDRRRGRRAHHAPDSQVRVRQGDGDVRLHERRRHRRAAGRRCRR